MTRLRRFLHRAIILFRPGKAESDLAREIDAHLQLLEDQFVAGGLTRDDARYAARRAFGGVEQAKERQRDERSFRWLTGWPMDLKLGVRMLAKSPGLTTIAVIALAVAIGAGAAYLEFTRDLLNPRLPVAEAGRIVALQVWDTERRAPHPRALYDFAIWRRNSGTLEHVGAALNVGRHVITGDGRADPARAVEISASAFRLFPVAPVLGRTLLEADEQPGAPPVVVIGHDLWRTRFGADPNVTERTVRIGSVVYTIVGVMPAEFGFPINHNLWAPLKVQPAGLRPGEGPAIRMFGRLKEGVSADAAQAELQGLLGTGANAPADGGGLSERPALRADVRPYVESLLATGGDNGSILSIVHAANLLFIMLLGICGANVATLVFARTAMREAEITVRTALGATRGRISAQLFAEALVLSSLAALAGLLVARLVGLWGRQIFTEAVGQPPPFWWDDGLSPETMLYAALLAVFAALIVGVIPAVKATGAQLQGGLRSAGSTGSTLKFGGLWTGVIVTQAAITVMFLATVVSIGWTALRGQHGLDVTFAREEFLTARMLLEEPGANPDARRAVDPDVLQAVAARLRNEAGVVNATYATALPGTTFEQFLIEFPSTGDGPAITAEANARKQTDVLWSEGARVGTNFFETMGIPLVTGRLFTDTEILGGHHVAVVDETFVRLMLGGRNPLGLLVRQPSSDPGGTPGPWHEIIGVVEDVTIRERKGVEDGMLYRPFDSSAAPALRLIVRTQGAASPMSRRLEAAALSANPDLRLLDVMSMDRVAEAEALPLRFFLRIFSIVATVALLLSTAGIYALISFTLARRTREIGIRIALGAAPRRIITGVFSRAFTQIGLGVLAGALPGFVIMVAGAEDAGGMGAAVGVVVTLAVCAFVILVAMISCAAPLRRALRIAPTEALRLDA